MPKDGNLQEEYIKNNTIIRVVAGSHAYGTNLPDSDWDERGVFIDSFERIALPFEKIEQFKFKNDDVVLYELSKFMPLLLDQNPNILEILWTKKSDILSITSGGERLKAFRKDFLTKRIKDSYVGYAISQLNRIKGHNKWINNPKSVQEPCEVDFVSVVWNYTENKRFNKIVPKEGYFAIGLGGNHFGLLKNSEGQFKNWAGESGKIAVIDVGQLPGINHMQVKPDLIVRFNEDLYAAERKNWKDYWGWKQNRNEKRAEMENTHGYDTKHAMHLIRLLKTGCEVLECGEILVDRQDKDFLLDIRNGCFSFEEIISMSQKLTQQVEQLAKKSNLPNKPNYALAKEVMLSIYKETWGLDIKEQKKLSVKL